MKVNKYMLEYIGMAIAAVVALVLMYTVIITPKRDAINTANQQAQAIEAKNQTLDDRIHYLMTVEPQLSMQKERLAQAQRQIPSSYDQQGFIANLNDAATQAGVTIQTVGFTDASLASLPTIATSKLTIGVPVQVPVSISASGTYDQLRDFVNKTQSMMRIAVPSSVSYSLGDTGGTDPASTVTMQLNIWSMLTSSTTVSGSAATDANANASSSSSSSK